MASSSARSSAAGAYGVASATSDDADPLFGLPDASWVTPATGKASVFMCGGPLRGSGDSPLDGSMGKVFVGTWDDRPVAAKIHCAFASADDGADVYDLRSNPASVQGILREVMRELRPLSKLQHENIIGLVGVAWGTYSGVRVPKYICMELGSHSLKDAMTQEAWGLVDARHRLCEVARGLEYLHHRGYVHRDIKPPNIVLVDGKAKICDLGLAKLSSSQSTASPGTLLYLATSEESESMSSSRDIFAFGVTMAEAIVKRSLERITHRRQLLEDAAAAFSAGAVLLNRCTDAYPARRPATTEVRQECERINASIDEAPDHRQARRVPRPCPPTTAAATTWRVGERVEYLGEHGVVEVITTGSDARVHVRWASGCLEAMSERMLLKLKRRDAQEEGGGTRHSGGGDSDDLDCSLQ